MKAKSGKRVFVILICLTLLMASLPAWALPSEAAGVEYYGRKQLASMSNATALLYAYDQIVAGVEEAKASISIYNGKNGISHDELKIVMDVYRRDYAHHFWLGNGYSYVTSDSTCTKIEPEYLMTGAVLAQAKKDFEAEANKILAGINSSMSELEREIYLHDTLADVVSPDSGPNAHNAYGAIVEGTAVCEGYTEALQYLLHRAGICAFIALGDGVTSTGQKERHSWNYVRIDGEFYQVDLTWDDQGVRTFHSYFNQTDAVMSKDHIADKTAYPLPVCNATKAMYFTGKETLLTSYDAGHIGRVLSERGLNASFYVTGSVEEFINWFKENIQAIANAAGVYGSFWYSHQSCGQEVCLILSTENCIHDKMEHHPGAKASCSVDGHKDYYHCSCGKYFEDANATVEIADLAAWIKGAGKIGKTGHNYADGWNFDSDGHWHGCACGDKTKSTAHQDGDKNGFCDACGYQTGTPPTEPPKNTEPPKTTEPPKETEPPKTTEPKETEPPKDTEPKETDPAATTVPQGTDPTESTDFDVTEPAEGDTSAATDPTEGDAPAEKKPAGTIRWIVIPVAIAVAVAVTVIIRKKR